MSRAEYRPGRFTQLDFDSLATVAGDTQAENGTEPSAAAVPLPAIQPFSGTGHKFVLRPGAIQYTLDAFDAPSAPEGTGVTDAAGSAHAASRRPPAQRR